MGSEMCIRDSKCSEDEAWEIMNVAFCDCRGKGSDCWGEKGLMREGN